MRARTEGGRGETCLEEVLVFEHAGVVQLELLDELFVSRVLGRGVQHLLHERLEVHSALGLRHAQHVEETRAVHRPAAPAAASLTRATSEQIPCARVQEHFHQH